MAALDFDPAKVQNDVIPKGEYRLVISGAEIKPTKAGDGLRLNLKLTVCGGQYGNRTLFEGLNIKNPNPTAQAMSEQMLKKICEAIGVLKLTDTAQLLNGQGGQISVPFMAYVDVKDNDGGLQNVLKKPRRIASGATSTAPVMASASENVPQVAASNAAPWEKYN